MLKLVRLALVAGLAAIALGQVCRIAAADQGLTIVTSYPPSFFEPFQQAFERRCADCRVTIIQRNTASAIRFILERTDAAADLFWASAPDAFERLKAAGALAKLDPRPTGAPERVAGYPLNDIDGTYLGFSLSRYGVVFNPSYLAEHGIAQPRRWEDLLAPNYAGHVGITTPSRSGTMHLMVETILQRYGWDQGWGMLSRLGGNLSTVTGRSFGVASGVAQRRFGVGLSIDFLAQAPRNTPGRPVFLALEPAIAIPASIAILARSRNKETAERFIDFLLSPEGQRMLLEPAIGRIPVRPDIGSYPWQQDASPGARFDAALSARRYDIVNLVFDEYIVRRRRALVRLWRWLSELEQGGPHTQATAAAIAEARARLTAPPLSAADAETLASDPGGTWQPVVMRNDAQKQAVAALHGRIEHNLAEAERLLSSVRRESR